MEFLLIVTVMLMNYRQYFLRSMHNSFKKPIDQLQPLRIIMNPKANIGYNWKSNVFHPNNKDKTFK